MSGMIQSKSKDLDTSIIHSGLIRMLVLKNWVRKISHGDILLFLLTSSWI
jgi:hypothetical protein